MAETIKGSLTGPAKLKAVTELVDTLTQDLNKVSLQPDQRQALLDELKIYGRDPTNADPIFTKEGINMLCQHAYHSPSGPTRRAALRPLANSMLLKPDTRQIFVDGDFPKRAVKALNVEEWDDEFLQSRVLFLSTYGTTVNIEELIEEYKLADYIVENIKRHAKLLRPGRTMFKGREKPPEPMEEMALTETLKLLFNVTYHCKDHVSAFSPAVPHIISLLFKDPVPQARPLEAPFGPLINALLNLDISGEKSLAAIFDPDSPTRVVNLIVRILEIAINSYKDSELDSTVSPTVTLLSKIHAHAPTSIKSHLRATLLPSAEDRDSVLGQGDGLTAKLLKTSVNPLAPALRDTLSHLYFDMSDKDASQFVKNIGYGFASGFLFQNNVPIPTSAQEAFSTNDATGAQRDINPITGQYLDKEKPNDAPEMTMEEKEREAERLFVLFERLRTNGVINVENPVATAVREGRFRELDDNEVEELDG